MRRYIDIVNETLLLESQRYEDMFNPVMKLAALIDQAHAAWYGQHQRSEKYDSLDDDIKQTVDDRATGTSKQRDWREKIAEEIRWAKSELKRQDRITWYLRLVRMVMIKPYWIQKLDRQDDEQIRVKEEATRLGEKWKRDYLAHLSDGAASWIDDVTASHVENLKRDLPHFLSLPIHEIQSYVFDRQVISQVYKDLNAFEKAWQEETRNTIERDGNEKVILSKHLASGEWVWLDLQSAYCSKEAEAMGHCGNKPAQFTDQNILSLRKKVERGGQVLWKPYATFIHHSDGSLGEMKGRFNDKPGAHGNREDVMEMVFELLKLPMITGITGGGHASHKNFSLNDLGPEMKEALLDLRPELGNAWYYYTKNGYDETFENILLKEITNEFGSNREIFDVNDDHVTIDQWEDLTRLVNSYDLYLDSGWPIHDLITISGGDLEPLGLDIIAEMKDTVWTDPLYAPARAAIEAAGMNVDEFFAKHDADMSAMQSSIEKKLSGAADEYALDWINLLPFDVNGIHFAKLPDGKIEARINTERLAKALDEKDQRSDDDFAHDFDGDLPFLGKVSEEGWLSYDQWEAQSEMIDSGETVRLNLKQTPDELLAKLRNVVARVLNRAIIRRTK